ncbi:hypothetical protein [Arenibaculum pallidiluteum]|uniref:hypothetical protein n=1 Tax=Arenibaculum pallidiluteum TaxID=2812559 RepID=UPI001A96A99D|nr:hypothetical protein [Arenibaculum pallidiluteum]
MRILLCAPLLRVTIIIYIISLAFSSRLVLADIVAFELLDYDLHYAYTKDGKDYIKAKRYGIPLDDYYSIAVNESSIEPFKEGADLSGIRIASPEFSYQLSVQDSLHLDYPYGSSCAVGFGPILTLRSGDHISKWMAFEKAPVKEITNELCDITLGISDIELSYSPIGMTLFVLPNGNVVIPILNTYLLARSGGATAIKDLSISNERLLLIPADEILERFNREVKQHVGERDTVHRYLSFIQELQGHLRRIDHSVKLETKP